MKRLLIFGLVGPTIGFLLAVLTAAALGFWPSGGPALADLFADAFAAGVVPAVLTGCVDGHLASRTGLGRRILLTPAAGYFICVVVGLVFLNYKLPIVAIMIFALYGMIAAAACSAIASRAVGKDMK
ncbi:MAG: hypothetical protein BGN84_02780 [Afipia sp. 62-7]|jgi:hypothetical protein|uniref:hypothetical protein n=1 Tax=Xanthobacter autotrophicus TaxID=280 RepID=UPI00092C0F6A|nr:hypothetical protein [Afipia sp.]MCO5131436.1 hypothetical protein [Xanthobacteraceae bacterium]OJU21424.1 MAG: hypothetical protein BGN84_02780 [Afipia sp. 62-7]